jgi:hypothetical protein
VDSYHEENEFSSSSHKYGDCSSDINQTSAKEKNREEYGRNENDNFIDNQENPIEESNN